MKSNRFAYCILLAAVTVIFALSSPVWAQEGEAESHC